ncbi:putative receptor protein-tyrosine kinase [Helianthus anomalus]
MHFGQLSTCLTRSTRLTLSQLNGSKSSPLYEPIIILKIWFLKTFCLKTEYAYTMQVTAPGNVYSFGVVLLEILTTRVPVDEEFGEGVDLVKWVQGAPTRGETPEQILDAKLSTVSFSWRKEMLSALKVALLCTDTTPAKRPKMKKVVEMLQEIVTESK